MNIYIAAEADYDYHKVIGVFDSLEGAQKAPFVHPALEDWTQTSDHRWAADAEEGYIAEITLHEVQR